MEEVLEEVYEDSDKTLNILHVLSLVPFANAGLWGLFALKILIGLLRSGKGESGSEYCNEFINFPHKCQELQ
jgi:hypothetical protein